jgi:hypothetical protein
MSHTFRVFPNGVTARIVLDGVDVSTAVRAYSITQNALERPVVTLALTTQTDVEEFSAENALIRVEVPEDEASATLRFLEPLDAGEFEIAVLNSMEMGGPQTFGEAALEVLRSYARGD